ncbi:MAG: hypothetical protein ACD_50C00158G0001, partial [uncultured bacterium]
RVVVSGKTISFGGVEVKRRCEEKAEVMGVEEFFHKIKSER